MPVTNTVVAAAVGVWYFGVALRGYKVEDDKVWAQAVRLLYHCDYRAGIAMSGDFMVPNSQNLLTCVW